MDERQCPQCFQPIDKKSRLFRDELCGHSKCKKCLLDEDDGCKQCSTEIVEMVDHNYHNEIIPNEECEIISAEEQCEIMTPEEGYHIRYEIVNVPEDGTVLMNGSKYEILQENYEEHDQYIEEEYLEPKLTAVEENCQIEPEQSAKEDSQTDGDTVKEFDESPPPPSKKVRSNRMPDFIEAVEIENEQTGDKDSGYRCNICNKTFKSAHQIRYHQYCDNSIEKPFKCDMCDVRYRTSYQLKQHRQLHSDVYFECSECGRKFQHDASAKKHWKKHFQKFPPPKRVAPKGTFPCEVCDKIFSRKDYLKKHMICHDSIKKYQCKQCNKTYARNNALKFHILTAHTARQDYECGCGKAFSTMQSLLRHQAVHSAVKHLKCAICGLKSSRKDNLLRHIRSFHPDANPKDSIVSETVDQVLVLDAEQDDSVMLGVSENEIRSKEAHLRKNVIVMTSDSQTSEKEYLEAGSDSEGKSPEKSKKKNNVYMEVQSVEGTYVVLEINNENQTKTDQSNFAVKSVPKQTKKLMPLDIYRKILSEDEPQSCDVPVIEDENSV